MKVLRKIDFPVPKRITDSDFDEICGTFNVSRSHQLRLKDRLDDLVDAFAKWMSDERARARRRPTRASDGEQLERALAHVRKAGAKIEKLGAAGQLAVRSVSVSIAPMLSAKWLSEVFSDDELAPYPSALPLHTGSRSPEHVSDREDMYFIEEVSLAARFQFVERRAKLTTKVVLTEIEKALTAALQSFELQPEALGGRESLKSRKYLIRNLAVIWEGLDKTVSGSANSEFTEFCEAFAASVGWPTEGMAAAVPKEISYLRNRIKKRGR
jgi:hypothetical protein